MPHQNLAMKVSWQTMAVNIVLSLFKGFAGIVAHSGAMLSDAVHSASDVLSTAVVMVGVRLAGREADADHPYGHERFESIATIVLAVVLALTGAGIGQQGIRSIAGGGSLAVPGTLALVAAAVSIAIKEGMYWYTRRAAKLADSDALMADAWHHRSDALSSVGSFAGILGARMGLPVLDPLASLVICALILKAAWDIFREGTAKLTDKACEPDVEAAFAALATREKGVVAVDSIRTRRFGSRIYVDIEIAADGTASLDATHAIAQRVHDAIERENPCVKHCMVHVNPARAGIRSEAS